jgi:hypothetical protein
LEGGIICICKAEILCTICSFGGKANCHLKFFGQKLVVVAGGSSQANGIVL